MASDDKTMTLMELAARARLPGRTIRYYIARGLLPGPAKAGRGAAYGRKHLARLREIQALQARGLTLAEIVRQMAGDSGQAWQVEPTAWWQYPLARDVVVQVRGEVSPWRLKQIKTCLARLAAALRANDES